MTRATSTRSTSTPGVSSRRPRRGIAPDRQSPRSSRRPPPWPRSWWRACCWCSAARASTVDEVTSSVTPTAPTSAAPVQVASSEAPPPPLAATATAAAAHRHRRSPPPPPPAETAASPVNPAPSYQPAVQPRQDEGPGDQRHPVTDQRRTAAAGSAHWNRLALPVPPGQHVLQLAEVVAVVGRVDLGGEQGDALGDERVRVLPPAPVHRPFDPGLLVAPASATRSLRSSFLRWNSGTLAKVCQMSACLATIGKRPLDAHATDQDRDLAHRRRHQLGRAGSRCARGRPRTDPSET